MNELKDTTTGLPGVHPPVQRLIAYSRGELEQRDAARVRKHATECADCGDQLAALMLLREHMILGIDEAPVRDVASSGGGRSVAAGVAAAVLALVVAVAAAVAWEPRPVGAGAEASVVEETLPAWHEEVLFASLVDGLGIVFGSDVRSVADGPMSDYERIGVAIGHLKDGDRDVADDALAPFRDDFNRFGSALHAINRYLMRAPDAGDLLESYYARSFESAESGVTAQGTLSPEAEAFYYLAVFRRASGDEQGALEALEWIAPDSEVGRPAMRQIERIRAGME